MDDPKDRRYLISFGHGGIGSLERWESVLRDYLTGTPSFDIPYFDFEPHKPSPLWKATPATLFPAAESVARTCWALWKDRPERIWNLVAEWTNQGGALETASFQILVTGSELGHLTPESAVETLGTWLAEESPRSRAAARLLPPVLASMPAGWNANRLHEWMDHSQPHLLRDIVISLFPLQPEPCIQLFFAWAQDRNRRFDGVLLACLQDLPAPKHASAAEYRQIEVRFRHLRLVVGKKNPRLNRKIDQFLQRLHGAAGKKANDPQRRGPGSRGPGPDRKK